MSESMAQDFGFTVVLGKQAHSRLRNCFYSTAVDPKDKSGSGIIKFSLLNMQRIALHINNDLLLMMIYFARPQLIVDLF
ncbi:hypothetical protein BMR05_00965 [Methylococcaceae bacterium HT4]|uniref:hypothetical protein n=1 Tax=Bathymodiolus platifrons methanotrophic gill symbiont TaxID=113268 RepID=UPI000B411821|nr:hypothetical protein [Bathymodiolus platifrons methanotrophic gill symbiont]TXK93108.1 hypothetical protein BMR10_16625 [Methylococcaceae bacterium CS4]TXL01318.1 hypothetical protein BMR11_00425 [Methylococcaceae bacterium CS5]TXL04742.1 hypothetical protein BMR08_16430 [Methylococcaceae bacterium CS2]TXL08938.1 hypothetical protein BMR07_00995 [Methylococcaceae bacterium CS1]TXL15780.1 hypothetical protein BMR06_15985 [Methylococcaceae bacterium HT5]TXL16120.1 hypothetical protein BMR05_